MSLEKHLAAGPLAGSLFQLERALHWLAKSRRGAEVGIEVLDDVAVRGAPDGLLILEQDKSGVGGDAPLADRHRNLWKTLGIWLSAVRDGEVDLGWTKFYLVTNKLLGKCWVRRLQAAEREKSTYVPLVQELRNIGNEPSDTLKPFVTEVLSFSDEEIVELLLRTAIEDASTASAGDDLYDEIAANLHLSANIDAKQVVQNLIGWVASETLRKIRAGEPAWLKREAFDNRVCQLIHQLHDKHFRERAERLLTVTLTDANRQERRNDLFVRQLLLLELEEDDELLLEAIDDVLCCEIEFTRLAEEGNVTEIDVLAFHDRLERRWRDIFRRHKRLARQRGESTAKAASIGLDILSETLEHREPLAGQETVEFYLTRGTYHQIADQPGTNGLPSLGWHPEFQQLLAERMVVTALAS